MKEERLRRLNNAVEGIDYWRIGSLEVFSPRSLARVLGLRPVSVRIMLRRYGITPVKIDGRLWITKQQARQFCLAAKRPGRHRKSEKR